MHVGWLVVCMYAICHVCVLPDTTTVYNELSSVHVKQLLSCLMQTQPLPKF